MSGMTGPTYPALYNEEEFVNDGGIVIHDVEYAGIKNGAWQGSSPNFENSGWINIYDTGGISIFNEGIISNSDEGYIELDDYLKGGEYINDGIIKNSSNGIGHSIDLINNGIFNDEYGKLNYNYVTNNGVIVRPIQGPIIGGNYVYNAFDIGNGSGFTFGTDWQNAIWGGINCGTYDPGNNSLYPNIYAQNDGELHAHISINGSTLSDFLMSLY